MFEYFMNKAKGSFAKKFAASQRISLIAVMIAACLYSYRSAEASFIDRMLDWYWGSSDQSQGNCLLSEELPIGPVSEQPCVCEAELSSDANSTILPSFWETINCIREGLPEERMEAAESVALHPGSHCPLTLLAAGIYFLENKDFEKAAVLIVGGFNRAEIDIRFNYAEKTDVLEKMQIELSDAYQKLTEEDWEIFNPLITNAVENFEVWDRATPRDYDCSWVRIFSPEGEVCAEFDDQEKQAILERFYRELKGDYRDEDAVNASREDDYFFEPTERRFYFNGTFSLMIPENVRPVIGRFGKYTNGLALPRGYISLNRDGSAVPRSFEDEYEAALENAKNYGSESEYAVDLCTLENGIAAFKRRFICLDGEGHQMAVVNAYCFVKDGSSFNIELICALENEVEYLGYLDAMVKTIEFSSISESGDEAE